MDLMKALLEEGNPRVKITKIIDKGKIRYRIWTTYGKLNEGEMNTSPIDPLRTEQEVAQAINKQLKKDRGINPQVNYEISFGVTYIEERKGSEEEIEEIRNNITGLINN